MLLVVPVNLCESYEFVETCLVLQMFVLFLLTYAMSFYNMLVKTPRSEELVEMARS